MDIEADDALMDALMMYFEACKLAGLEFVDIEEAIKSHNKWQNDSIQFEAQYKLWQERYEIWSQSLSNRGKRVSS